jgi:hypothetical protein
MCADGPAVDLDFYDLEFMGGLSVHNRLMYCRRKTNNLLRSWILFQVDLMEVVIEWIDFEVSIVVALEDLEA